MCRVVCRERLLSYLLSYFVAAELLNCLDHAELQLEKMLLLLLIALSLACASATVDVLAAVHTPEAALAAFAGGDAAPSQADILAALERGWWGAAASLLVLSRERGEAVDEMDKVLSAAIRVRDEASGILSLLRVSGSASANAEETSVSCAFQWAQRPDFVYLEVKFSSRLDGPVTVLNVDDERVTLTNSTLEFVAAGRQKPKMFRLDLEFFGDILPSGSSWRSASVGRMAFTIAKASHENWPRLLRDRSAKPRKWHERQVILDAELAAESKREKETAENEAQKAETSEPPKKPPKKKSRRSSRGGGARDGRDGTKPGKDEL